MLFLNMELQKADKLSKNFQEMKNHEAFDIFEWI